MNECKECKKSTENSKFCSRSCAATFNNRGMRRHGNAPLEANCLNCQKKLYGKSTKYCDQKCQSEYQHKEKIQKWKLGEDIGNKPIKRYLRSKRNECWCCGIKDWNDKPIVLELEHIDGNHRNNKEENLSLLCPNCHSQTPTYKSRNRGNGRHSRRERYQQEKSF